MSARMTAVFVAFLMVAGVSAQTVPLLTEDFKLTPSDGPALGQGFGWSVDISGNVIVVGAAVDSTPHIFGAAYVFQRQGSAWVEQTKLTASERFPYDRFGSDVAIDGDYLVVGTPSEGGPERAYVFHFDGGTWVEQAILTPTGGFIGHIFGQAVAISGDRIVVGAPGNFGSANSAYVFRREGTTWIEEAALVGADTVDGDRFGDDVAINGNTVLVGAPYNDTNGDGSGATYVFRLEGTTWAEETQLTPGDAGPLQFFGRAVSLNDDVAPIARSSELYVFTDLGQGWIQDDQIFTGTFGSHGSVDNNADLILVGAEHDGVASNAGAALVFRRFGTQWAQIYKLIASDGGINHRLGHSAALDASTVIVGTNGAHAAYVYTIPEPIPAVGNWGIVAMVLLLMVSGSIVLKRKCCGAGSAHFARVIVLSSLLCSTASFAAPPNFSVPHHPQRLILRFKDSVSTQSKQNIHASFGAVQLKSYRHVSGLVLVSAPPAQLEAIAAQYNAHPDVLYAEPCNALIHL